MMIVALRKVIKRMHYPLEVMLTCVRWYAAYPLSLRHIKEMMAERGVAVDHATVQRIEVKRVMREDGQRGDGVADAVVGRMQRGLAQVLLVGRFQHVVGDVAGARHDLIAVVHRLRDDDRHQAVGVGHLLRVAWLQRRQRRQELALSVGVASENGFQSTVSLDNQPRLIGT